MGTFDELAAEAARGKPRGKFDALAFEARGGGSTSDAMSAKRWKAMAALGAFGDGYEPDMEMSQHLADAATDPATAADVRHALAPAAAGFAATVGMEGLGLGLGAAGLVRAAPAVAEAAAPVARSAASIIGRIAQSTLMGATGGAIQSGGTALLDDHTDAALPEAAHGALIGGLLMGVPSAGLEALQYGAAKLAASEVGRLPKIDYKSVYKRGQLQSLFSEIKKASPELANDRAGRLDEVSKILGRDINSFTELTDDELLKAHNYFRGLRGAKAVTFVNAPAKFSVARAVLKDMQKTVAGKDPGALIGAWRWVGTSVESALNKMGTAGQIMARSIRDTGNAALARAAPRVWSLKEVLDTLNPSQIDNLVDVVQGADVTTDAAVQKTASLWREATGEVADHAQDVRLRLWDRQKKAWVEWQPKENYYPRQWTKESLAAMSEEERTQLLDTVIENGHANDYEQAKNFLTQPNEMRTPETLNRSLQARRYTDLPGYDRDAKKVMINYLINAWHRIELARTFGPKNEIADGLIARIGQTSGKWMGDLARNGYSTFAGYRPWEMQQVAKAGRSFAVPALLSPTSTLKHTTSQLTSTIATGGLRDVTTALKQMWTPSGKEFLGRSGVLLRDVLPEIMSEDTKLGNFSKFWTKAIGLRGMVTRQRMLSALTGAQRADELAHNYAADYGRNNEMGTLIRNIGLDPEDVLKQGGQLTDFQRRIAAIQFTNNTQLMSRALDLPAAKNSAAGQFLYFLRSSAFQQSRAIKDHVMKPFSQYWVSNGARGDYKPMVRFLTMTGTLGVGVGEAINGLRQIIRGSRPRSDMPALVRVVDDASTAAHAGILDELFKAAYQGPGAWEDFVLGPYGSLMAEAAYGTARAATGNPKPLVKTAVSTIPLVGTRLSKEIPSK